MARKHKCGSTERILTAIETCAGCAAVTRITPLVDGEKKPERRAGHGQ